MESVYGIENRTSLAYASPMTIKAVVHVAEEGGFWAEVPALPGCVTQGGPNQFSTSILKHTIS